MAYREGSKAYKIIQAVRAEPELSTADLVAKFRCTRQYIHNVLRTVGLHPEPVRRVWAPAKPEPAKQVMISEPCTSIKGSIAELLTASDLMAKGWSVFFPLFRARSDLIATSKDGQTVLRFEVRSAKRRNGEVTFNRKPTDAYDHYAIVIGGEPIIYRPALPENKM